MKQRKISVYLRFLMSITAVCLTSIFFISCKNQPIFYAIEQEVKLKDFSVKSSIVGFARIGDDIYTANTEAVYTKKINSTGSWTSLGSPGDLIQGIATDGTYLFGVGLNGTVKFRNSSGKWEAVPDSENIKMVFGDTSVFGMGLKDNKPSVYKITCTSVTEIKSLNKDEKNTEILTGASGNYFATTEGLFSHDGTAVSGSPIKEGKIISVSKGKGGNSVFALTDKAILYYFNGTGWSEKKVEKQGPFSIFYFAGRNTVLIGCKQGYTEIQLSGSEDKLTAAKELKPGTQGSTTPPECLSQYQSVTGSYSITPIFAVGDDKTYALFVGAAAGSTPRNTGLWAFYSTHTKEWNRE